jgi:hypothetical protein
MLANYLPGYLGNLLIASIQVLFASKRKKLMVEGLQSALKI